MTLRQRCAAAIAATGGTLLLEREGIGVGTLTGSLQLRGSGERNASPLGGHTPAHYTLYAAWGSVAEDIREGDSLLLGDRRYLVRSAAPVFFGGQAVYYKASLVPEQEGW